MGGRGRPESVMQETIEVTSGLKKGEVSTSGPGRLEMLSNLPTSLVAAIGRTSNSI